MTATIPVGTAPNAIAVDPATDTVYVTSIYDEKISVIDEATRTVTATIPVGASRSGWPWTPSPAPST